jgi:thiol-disulfide isomerase/thioredoxin
MVYLKIPAGGWSVTRKKTLASIAILILASAFLTNCSRNDRAPNFKLRSLNGRQVSLDQFKGKVVLLDFWQTTCGPCRMTMPLLERLQKEYPRSMALLAINMQESPEPVRDYVREQDLNSEVLLDEDGSVATAYDVEAIPTQVLIDKEGIIRRVMVGFRPDTMAQLRSEIQKLQ